MQQAGIGTSSLQRHLQSSKRQVPIIHGTERPTDDIEASHVRQGSLGGRSHEEENAGRLGNRILREAGVE
jgi:hypothetical protein